jgi:cytochrome c553
MKTLQLAIWSAILAAGGVYLVSAQQATPQPPREIPVELRWAYGYGTGTAPINNNATPPAVPQAAATDPNELVKIPGSSQALRRAIFRRAKGDEGVKEVPDWAPDTHPPMPAIVKFGRSVKDASGNYVSARDRNGNIVYAAGGIEDGGIRACGFCHSAHGMGHPGNGAIAGLPASYLMQQMEDFRNGLRNSSDPTKGNTMRMAWYATQTTAEETRASVEYFSTLPYVRNVRVVETTTVPKTRVTEYFIPLTGAAAGTEPIDGRIIEVPEHPELTALRAPNVGFIAYVPPGAVSKGEQASAKFECATCHGRTLGGVTMPAWGDVPAIAGRSPGYVVRQMFDMKTGARRGPKAMSMKATVDRMTPEDMINVAAYVAAQPPPAPQAR